MTNTEMKRLYNEIRELLVDSKLGYDGIDVHKHYELPVTQVQIEIIWGDWKHEHLRTKFLIEDYLESKGLHVFSHQEDITDEDGSDTYSAVHTFNIIG